MSPESEQHAWLHKELLQAFSAGRMAIAEALAAQLLQTAPANAFAWKALATARMLQGKECLADFQRAAACAPNDAEVFANMGSALRNSGATGAALATFEHARELAPRDANIHGNLGSLQRTAGRYLDALNSFMQAVALAPDSAPAHYNLGNMRRSIGDIPGAIESYQSALRIDPGLTRASSNLAYTLNLSSSIDDEERFKAARDFGLLFPTQASTGMNPDNDGALQSRPPDKPLHIGLISGDFRTHPVAFFLAGVLEALSTQEHAALRIHAYANHRHQDAYSHRLQQACTVWRVVADMDDVALAAQIQADHIDILIDLSGHTALHRLPVFAHKPAPIQISWLGYFATTGLSSMDYILADPWSIAPDCSERFTERPWLLPETRLCFTPPDLPLDPGPLPALSHGHLTFGCFNNLSKITPEVIALWASILQSLPHSRLLLKTAPFVDAGIAEAFIARFAACGIARHRLTLESASPHHAYLAGYNHVDIALDPFPYPGGTTTAESLWMGVPVLTLAGKTLASRQGLSMLMNVGLAEWVTYTPEEYRTRAIHWASDLDALAALRPVLRKRLLNSPLCDAPRFARHFAHALHQMWSKHLAPHQDKYMNTTAHKTFLHIGCGPKRKDRTTAGFNTPEWHELRLDINEAVSPDIVGTMTDMSAVESGSVDAIFSSHNIEHLYPHEVPLALAEFRRVLKPDGFAVITCPDLQSVCALVANDRLTEPAYTAPAGPIAPLDILYGHRPPMAKGNLYMAHRCGFTQRVLIATLQECGFAMVASKRREHPAYDLWAVACKSPTTTEALKSLAALHFPK